MNLISAMTGDRRFEEAYSRQMKQKQIPMTELYDWLFGETAAQYAEKGREEGLTAMVSPLRSLKVDPEEACRLVLRTFLKYGDLRGKGAKLAIESPAG